MKPNIAQPLHLAALYLLIGSAWILIGDYLLEAQGQPFSSQQHIQTWKGLTFVLLSSGLIYLISRAALHAQKSLQQNVQTQAQQLLQTQRAADLGNWSFDGEFHWSAEALRVLGQPSTNSHTSLETFLSWLLPAERRPARQALADLETGHSISLNTRLNRSAGQVDVWLTLLGESTRSNCASGTIRNISAQKRDELSLRESEQRFRQLFEQTPRIAVQGYDRDRRVIYWNQASTLLYGYSQQEALGRHIEELIIPPAQRGKVVNEINHWMIGGTPIPAAEISLLHRDGRSVRVFSSHLLLKNPRNQLELYCVDIDISEQQANTEALYASELRYRQLVEQLNEAIFLTDSHGHLTFLNLAWWSLCGHSPEQSLNEPLANFLLAEDAAELRQHSDDILQNKIPRWVAEYRLRCANGAYRWVELQLAKDDETGGLRGSLSDIHLKHQHQELIDARNAVLDELQARLPLQQILSGIANRLEDLCTHLHVSIMLLQASGRLKVATAPSLPEAYRQAADNIPDESTYSTCQQAVLSGELVINENILLDTRWEVFHPLARELNIASCWSLPLKNDADEVLGTIGLYSPRTGRPGAEDIALVSDFSRLAALAIQQQQQLSAQLESEQRFRATFEQAAVGIAHVAPDGRWLRVNSRLCQMLGFSQEQLLEQTFQDITHPDDLAADLQQTNALLNGEQTQFSIEKRYCRADGTELWANLTATLVRTEAGEPLYFISVLEDICARKQQEAELRLAATVFASTRESVLITDSKRRVLSANPAFSKLIGLSPEAILNQRLPIALPDSAQRSRYRQLWQAVQHSGHWQGEMLGRRADGQLFPLLISASQVVDEKSPSQQYVLVLSDISQFKQSQERIARMANYDLLTNLPNRQLGYERLRQAMDRAKRQDSCVAVLFIDLDHFKNINDSLGHPVGDALLTTIAERLQQRLRETDILARLGGDEFMVLLENINTPEEAAQIASALLRLFESPFSLADEREVYLGASIGISLYPDDSRDRDELVRNADAAMYQAKSDGRNTFCFYTSALTERSRLRLTLEARLRTALKHGEFTLHYQPLVDTHSGATLGVEALLRWKTATETFHPADFIPLAEDTGLIVPLGAWVLREACRQVQSWRNQGLELQTLAVNLSPRQFRQPDLIAQVQQALQTSGLPANCLELEITEGALMDDVKVAQATLAALKRLGVRLAIDDFGTGYSSLAYLRRFPLDKLKIDKSFLCDVPEDQANLEIVSTIIALARGLKLTVIAEGVETAAQLATLRQMECNQCQGYLFSRPLAASDLALYLQNDCNESRN